MKLVAANASARMRGEGELPGKINYFLGDNPKDRLTNIATYRRVRTRSVYPGIDLVYYGNQRQLEYDFVIAPGSSPKAIKLAFSGAKKLSLDGKGDLVLQTVIGSVVQHAPLAYQNVNGRRRAVACKYVVQDANRVAFKVAAYDVKRPLVIDPTLVFSTYLGGSSNDNGAAIATDPNGNVYVTGSSTSTDFPLLNPLYSTGGFPFRPFVTKFNPSASSLIYSTFFGTWGDGDGIVADSSGNAYVAGEVDSITIVNGFQTSPVSSQPGFIAKLNSTGTTILYSTYIGGEL